MRLTLRTLLAWMDGVLPPEDARALGEKVDESQVARRLVDRIGEVVSNERLGSPRLLGKGLAADANSVAEYLDNVLSADRLEAFETICLESDMHLAEVASCHAILAEVARDPEVLEPFDEASRRALLESIEHRFAARSDIILGGAAATGRQPSAESGRRVPVTAPRAPRADTTRRSSVAAWAMLGSAVLLLGLLSVIFARSAGILGPRQAPPEAEAAREEEPVRPDRQPAAEPADVAAAPAAEEAARAPEEAVAAGAEIVAPVPPVDDAPAIEAPAIDDPAGAEEDMAAADAAPEPAAAPPVPDLPTKVPAGEALAIAAGTRRARPAAPKPPAVGPEAALEANVGLAPAAGLGFVAGDGVPLRRVKDGDLVTWAPCPAGTAIDTGDELVVPAGMRPELNLAGISVWLSPRSEIRIDAEAGEFPRVAVVSGRLVARAARNDARLGVRAGGIGGVVVAGLDGGVAVEVERGRGAGTAPAEAGALGTLVAVSGPLVFEPEGGPPTPVPARGMLRADAGRPGRLAAFAATGELADWVTGTARPDPLERVAADTFVARLEALPPGGAASAGLDQVLLSMAIDRRVENRVFAATTLASLGRYDVAVDLLCAEAPGRKLEGRQWAALFSAVVPRAIAAGEDSAELLRRAWEDRGPPGRAEILMTMSRGPTDGELADGADRVLVEALSEPSLVMRRVALATLVDIVQPSAFDRARFRPDGSPESRRDGAAWWAIQQERGAIRRSR